MKQSFEYVDVPSCATHLTRREASVSQRPAAIALPRAQSFSGAQQLTPSSPKMGFNMASMLMSVSMNIPTPPAAPQQGAGQGSLLSNRIQLSIPVTTVNFTRFVSRAGPIFWVQDRVEEIVMWRKGNAYTAAWLSGYAFLCYFPRLVLLVPHASLIALLLSTYSAKKSETPAPPTSYLQSYQEGSAGWYANLQAIQNLMGVVSDGYDSAVLALPIATHNSQYTALLLLVLIVSFVAMLPILPFIPLRPTFLVLGLAPFIFTHPFVQARLPALAASQGPLVANARMALQRFADDDKLAPEVWNAPLDEVDLWENERWDGPHATWSKQVLLPNERRAWTRGRDGFSGGMEGEGSLSHTTFALEPGWAFVETESWRVDLAGTWTQSGADADGWVYTNDTWQEPHATVPLEWKTPTGAMTRRRRWTRRIYYKQIGQA